MCVLKLRRSIEHNGDSCEHARERAQPNAATAFHHMHERCAARYCFAVSIG